MPASTRERTPAPPAPPAAALECIGLAKSYGNVRALAGVDMRLAAGEVRALLGKNGAGKSTFVNLVAGFVTPDAGTIKLRGRQVHWTRPADALSGGIAVVHQEFSLVPGLSVAENVTLGRWPRSRRFSRFIDTDAMEATARTALEQLGEDLPLWRAVGSLSLAQQQLVEIAKALSFRPDVLILDEPTSSLHAREVDALLTLVRRLASQGVAVIYVSHRMQEIPRVADALTVLRDGAEVATMNVEEVSAARVAEMIAGESQTARVVERRDHRDMPVALSVRGMGKRGLLHDVSFDVHEGEVLGIAGLLGSGRSELLEGIFGARTDTDGEVRVGGEQVRHRTPGRMLSRGVGLTSEDRKNAGIVPQLSIGENLMLSARGRVLPRWWIAGRAETRLARTQVDDLSIATSTLDNPISALSGGNQQKGLIGRLLAARMRVLLLDEPTRGIDVHAKSQVYQLIRKLAHDGVACVFVSSELDELAELCDRVLILRNGRIAEELPGDEASTELLLALAMKESNGTNDPH